MSNEHDIRLEGFCFLCRAFFFLITLAWLGCLMSVKLLLPPLCTGWHELGTDWLRPSHDNISQAVSSERERREVHTEWRLWGEECEEGRVLHNRRRRGETQPAPGACLGPGPLMWITKASTQRQSGRHFKLLAFTSLLLPPWNAGSTLLGKLKLIPCVFQNWKQWLVDNHPACAALTVLYRRKVTLTFAQKLTTLPMNSNHQNIRKPGEKK